MLCVNIICNNCFVKLKCINQPDFTEEGHLVSEEIVVTPESLFIAPQYDDEVSLRNLFVKQKYNYFRIDNDMFEII